MTLIDKYSNYTWVANFRTKVEVSPWLIKFISELLEQGIMKIKKIKCRKNVADTMTKALGRLLFFQHRATYMTDILSLRQSLQSIQLN